MHRHFCSIGEEEGEGGVYKYICAIETLLKWCNIKQMVICMVLLNIVYVLLVLFYDRAQFRQFTFERDILTHKYFNTDPLAALTTLSKIEYK